MKNRPLDKVLLGVSFLATKKSAKILKKPTKIINEAKYSGAVTEYAIANNPNFGRARISTAGVYSITKEMIIDTFPLSYGNAAKWTVSLTNGVKFVSSEIVANWDKDGKNLKYSEFGVNTISDDEGSFDIVVDGKNVLLKFIPINGEWNVKLIRNILGISFQPTSIANFRTFSWIFPAPNGSYDQLGNNNDRSYDENFFYVKIDDEWLRTPLVNFTVNVSSNSGEDLYWYNNLPFVDRPRVGLPKCPTDPGLVGAQTFDDDYFYIKDDVWKRVLLINFLPSKMTTFNTFSWIFPAPNNSNDSFGNNNDRSYDENFFYAKVDNQWLRSPLINFTVNVSPNSGENEYWYDNLPFVDRPRASVPTLPVDFGLIGAQTFDDDYFYIKDNIWKRILLINFLPSKMTTFE